MGGRVGRWALSCRRTRDRVAKIENIYILYIHANIIKTNVWIEPWQGSMNWTSNRRWKCAMAIFARVGVLCGRHGAGVSVRNAREELNTCVIHTRGCIVDSRPETNFINTSCNNIVQWKLLYVILTQIDIYGLWRSCGIVTAESNHDSDDSDFLKSALIILNTGCIPMKIDLIKYVPVSEMTL